MEIPSYILPETAWSIIESAACPLPAEQIALAGAHRRVVHADIPCPIDHPLFDQSAVDGYAIRHQDLAHSSTLRVVDHFRAGNEGLRRLQPGECVRIFTGAAIPPDTDTIVMQEHCIRTGDSVVLTGPLPALGAHVRYAGEQIRAGQCAVQAGTRLGPGSLGFLASIGIDAVAVTRLPKVAIFVTGDEFAQGKEELRRGLIFESNGLMLAAALQELGISASVMQIPENMLALAGAVSLAKVSHDVVIVTGGVSVGDHDHTREALEHAGFETRFHQVRQKPGKPMLFATQAEVAAFGLPGNPRAALLGYYVYIRPFLLKRMGAGQIAMTSFELPLVEAYSRKPDGKVHIVAAQLCPGGMRILSGQASHMLQSFNAAELIVMLPAEGDSFPPGTVLQAHLIPV